MTTIEGIDGIRLFKDHWYAPAHHATHKIVDYGVLESINGGSKYHCVESSGMTRGLAAIKPFPLDCGGMYVCVDGALMAVCYGCSLTDYAQGTPAQLAAWVLKNHADYKQYQENGWAGARSYSTTDEEAARVAAMIGSIRLPLEPRELDDQGRYVRGTYAGMTPAEVLHDRELFNRLMGE